MNQNSFGCWLLRYSALMLLGYAAYEAYHFPVFGMALVAGLGIYALALAIEVRVWLLVLPSAIAVLSLGFWSGRYFWDVFDLFMLVTLAGGLWYCRASCLSGASPARFWPLAVFALAQIAITFNGLYPLSSPVPGLWADYFASTNALREAKGVAWALLLVPMLMQAQRIGPGAMRWLVAGMALGILALFVSVLWERNLYTGIWNFASAYRVSGWFFDLHTGGAAIDIALAMMLPFLFGLSVWWRKWPAHLFMVLALLLGFYALFVTFSRANYLALAAIFLVLLAGFVTLPGTARKRRRQSWWYAGVVVAIVFMLPFALGGTILHRFQATTADIKVRVDHWSDSADLVVPGVQTWVGIGKGAFPRHYHLARELDGESLSTVFRHGSGDAAFVRFSASDGSGLMDLRQRFRPLADKAFLHLTMRTSAHHQERLLVEFCERHMLRVNAQCRWVGTNLPDTGGEWRDYSREVSLAGLGDGGLLDRSPVDISILNRGIKQRIDIKSVRLVAPDGRELLHNTGFAQGLDHWYMVDGNHLRWHVKNIFVFSFVEGGLLGLSVFLLLTVLSLKRSWQLHRRGDPAGLFFAAAIVGGLSIGLFDSVLDAPRVAVLLLLPMFSSLIWIPEPIPVASRLPRYPDWLPRPITVMMVTVAGSMMLALVFRVVMSQERPEQLLIDGLSRLGVQPEAAFDWVNRTPKALDSSFDLNSSTGPRRIWRRLVSGTERISCNSNDMRWAAVCWAVERDRHRGLQALAALRALNDVRPSTYGDYGNGWLLAVLYDLLSDHPDMSLEIRTELQDRLRQQLRHHLLLLNSEGPAVWHGRTTLAAQSMIIAAVLDVMDEHASRLLRQSHFHFLELLESLSVSEAWPEGYNYWVNSRGFLVALAAFAYTESFPSAQAVSQTREIMSRTGLWHLYNSRPDFRAIQIGDEGARIDQREETQRIVDTLALVTGETRLREFSSELERRFQGDGYYRDYRWLRPLLRGWLPAPGGTSTAWKELPLAAWFGRDAMNQIYLRSDWSEQATVLSFRAGHTLSHHGHADAGHFTLFKGAPLAVTGASGQRMLDASNRIDYGVRTVSKNSILVMRPGELVQPSGYVGPNVSDGGQRLPMALRNPLHDLDSWRGNLHDGLHLEGGRVIAFHHEEDEISYIRADLTASYNTRGHDEGGEGGKVDRIERRLVYLRRLDRVLIHDRIDAVSPMFKAKWLLQSEVRPEFDGGLAMKGNLFDGVLTTNAREFAFENGAGHLSVQSLLPSESQVHVIGGDNHRFYVDVDGHAGTVDGLNMSQGAWIEDWFEPALWRLEISDRRDTARQDFLTLLSPSIGEANPADAAVLEAMPESILAVRIDDELVVFAYGNEGASFEMPAMNRVRRVRLLGLPPEILVRWGDRNFISSRSGTLTLGSSAESAKIQWKSGK